MMWGFWLATITGKFCPATPFCSTFNTITAVPCVHSLAVVRWEHTLAQLESGRSRGLKDKERSTFRRRSHKIARSELEAGRDSSGYWSSPSRERPKDLLEEGAQIGRA